MVKLKKTVIFLIAVFILLLVFTGCLISDQNIRKVCFNDKEKAVTVYENGEHEYMMSVRLFENTFSIDCTQFIYVVNKFTQWELYNSKSSLKYCDFC